VFGLLVAAIGVLFTLDNLGFVQAEDYLRFWPAGLVAIGLLKLWQSRQGGGALAGFLFLAVGGWLLLEQLTIFDIQFADIWPLLLVFVGSYLVWQGLSVRASTRPDAHSTVSAMAILGGVSRGNSSRAFQGADLTAIMGGCELDLRNSTIDGEAVIDVFALWGGIEIRVPEGWAVESRIVPILGSVEDKTRVPQGMTPSRLVLRGFAVMGGIDIKN
jgi:predicted membrane protein